MENPFQYYFKKYSCDILIKLMKVIIIYIIMREIFIMIADQDDSHALFGF